MHGKRVGERERECREESERKRVEEGE